jgi:predicted RNase H-like nuclease (RuvC/YqgF family)
MTSKRKREAKTNAELQEEIDGLQKKITKYQQKIEELKEQMEENALPEAYEKGQVIVTCEELDEIPRRSQRRGDDEEYPHRKELKCEFRIGFTLKGYKWREIELEDLDRDALEEFHESYGECYFDMKSVAEECDNVLDQKEWRQKIYDSANYDESPACGSIEVPVTLFVYCKDKDKLDKFCE